MGFKIDIKGDIDGIFKEQTRKIKDQVQNELNKFGLSTVNDAKRLAPVYESQLRQHITFVPRVKDSLIEVDIIAATNYAAYVEYGTGPMAAKYVATLPKDWQAFAKRYKGKGGGSYDEFLMRIFNWVKKKKLTLNPKQYEQGDSYTKTGKLRKPRKRKKVDKEKGQQQLAYLIAKKIMREGIKPQPFLFPAISTNRIKLIKNLKALK